MSSAIALSPSIRFKRWMTCGLFMMAAVAIPLIGSSVYSLWKMMKSQDALIATQAQELILVRELQNSMTRQQATMPIFVLTADPVALQANFNANREFARILQNLSFLEANPARQKQLGQILSEHQQLVSLSKPGIALKKRGEPTSQVNAYFSGAPAQQAQSLQRLIQDFSTSVEQEFREVKTANSASSQGLLQSLMVAAATAIFFLVVIAWLLTQRVRHKHDEDLKQESLFKKETQMSQARKETVEVVAHDLKNPISSIIMSTEIALMQKQAPPEEIQTLEITLRSARSMQKLVDDLLDHAKIESGSLAMEKRRNQVSTLLSEMHQRFQPLADQRQIRLESKMGLCPPVVWDASRMEQVLSNLLGNALKFTPVGGWIRLQAESKDGHIIITVMDSGAGMTAEQAAHVFERYWQVRATAKQGIGLGLSIAQAIVQAHGGRIWVESTPGKGSSFSFAIPHEKEDSLTRTAASLQTTADI